MKIVIDTEQQTLDIQAATAPERLPLYSVRAFEIISHIWLKAGWDQKYSYTFTWLGRPIIQLPEDAFRMQELIFQLKPDLIVETGVAHGGSLIFYASLCKILGKGRVIGIDIEIRPHNRKAIENHPLASYITLIEGSSVAPEIISKVKSLVQPEEKVLVLLDSCHMKEHVDLELEAYHSIVSKDSYVVAMDGVMQDLSDLKRGQSDWSWNNPVSAVEDFAKKHPEFIVEQPAWLFNESQLSKNITYWPSAFLRRIR